MHRNKKLIWLIPVCIFLIALGVRLWDINAQGETWDEIAYFNASKSYMRNLKNLDFNAQHWNANKEHPPIAKYIYGLGSLSAYLNHELDYTNGRILSAIMGALTILIIYFFAKDLFSIRVATLSSAILIFLPQFIGLNKVYGLDTPTTLFFVLTIYLFTKAIINSSDKFYILSGISLGLAIATRYNNALLFILLPIIFLILKTKDILSGKDRRFLWYILIIPLLALLVLFLSWPWLWKDTLAHWNTTIGHWGGIKEIFFGEIVSPGYSYYFVYFLITIPILILLLLIPFLFNIFKNKNNYIILAWILTMFLVVLSPTKQNGIRYIIAIYPAVAIASSVGFFYLFKNKLSIIICLSILMIYLISINIFYHPYYLNYFNESVGGIKKVYEQKLFPIGYWGEGLEEACRWISDKSPADSTIFINTSPNHTTGGKLRDDLNISSDDPDYIILNLSSIWYNEAKVTDEYEMVHSINTLDVPFIQIFKKKNQ